MNVRWVIGGGSDKKAEEARGYSEGYNTGYNDAHDEMRRRGFADTRSHYDEEDYEPEMRRRRRRTRGQYDGDVMPRGEARYPIGFVRRHDMEDNDKDGMMARMMDMLEDVHKSHKHLQKGAASSVEKLDPRLGAVLETAVSVMENPPSTWDPYLKRSDYLAIAKMELKELVSALEDHKPLKDIRKELSHSLAAVFQMAEKQ